MISFSKAKVKKSNYALFNASTDILVCPPIECPNVSVVLLSCVCLCLSVQSAFPRRALG